MAGQVIPVDEAGVRLSDEFVARVHDGRAVAYIGADEDERPQCLLDLNAQIRTGGCDFRFEHFEIDAARVTAMFPEIKPCDPTQNEDVQKYFIHLLRKKILYRIGVAIILEGEDGRIRAYSGEFVAFREVVDETQQAFMPAFHDPAKNIFCAKLSNDNRCLGVLYVQGLERIPFSREDRSEITRIAGYISIFFASFQPPRPKNPRLMVLSGPDKGKVIPVTGNSPEFGPSGIDDPEPAYRIEVTDRGTELVALPDAMERRQKNVLGKSGPQHANILQNRSSGTWGRYRPAATRSIVGGISQAFQCGDSDRPSEKERDRIAVIPSPTT